jgi:hypothetical protein
MNNPAAPVTVAPQQHHQIVSRLTHSAPPTPAKLPTVIRAQQSPRTSIIQHQVTSSMSAVATGNNKVHLQAGQQQQSIVLPVRTTPLTTQSAVVTSVAFPISSGGQLLTSSGFHASHPSGTIQTVKIGGAQAQVIICKMIQYLTTTKMSCLCLNWQNDH